MNGLRFDIASKAAALNLGARALPAIFGMISSIDQRIAIVAMAAAAAAIGYGGASLEGRIRSKNSISRQDHDNKLAAFDSTSRQDYENKLTELKLTYKHCRELRLIDEKEILSSIPIKHNSIEELKNACEAIEKKLNPAVERLLKEEIPHLRKELQDTINQLSAEQRKSANLDERLNRQAGKIRKLEETIEGLKLDKQNLTTANDALKKEKADLQAQNQQLQAKVRELEGERDALKGDRDGWKANYQLLKEQNDILKEQLKEEKKKNSDLLAEEKKKNGILVAQLAEQKTKLEKVSEQLSQLTRAVSLGLAGKAEVKAEEKKLTPEQRDELEREVKHISRNRIEGLDDFIFIPTPAQPGAQELAQIKTRIAETELEAINLARTEMVVPPIEEVLSPIPATRVGQVAQPIPLQSSSLAGLNLIQEKMGQP